MQSKGFTILAKRSRDEQIKRLLQSFSCEEEKHAEFWSCKVKELGGKAGSGVGFFRDLKTGFIFRILGAKGFFEWTIAGEEEVIHDLALEAGNVREHAASEAWSRLASDERLHLEMMKTEVLNIEAGKQDGGGIRDMIFGVNDGLVSTLAFVVGAFGAFTDSRIVLVSGIAELLAGTISMAVSSYPSTKSELEVLENESQRKRIKKRRSPEEEQEALIQFYHGEGFSRVNAEAIVKRIMETKEISTQADALEQLGLSSQELGNPVRSGALCGTSFALAALVPIVPFALPLSSSDALLVSIFASVVTLFGVGCLRTIFSRKKWLRSGLEMMIIGISAAGITFIIGKMFSLIL